MTRWILGIDMFMKFVDWWDKRKKKKAEEKAKKVEDNAEEIH